MRQVEPADQEIEGAGRPEKPTGRRLPRPAAGPGAGGIDHPRRLDQVLAAIELILEADADDPAGGRRQPDRAEMVGDERAGRDRLVEHAEQQALGIQDQAVVPTGHAVRRGQLQPVEDHLPFGLAQHARARQRRIGGQATIGVERDQVVQRHREAMNLRTAQAVPLGRQMKGQRPHEIRIVGEPLTPGRRRIGASAEGRDAADNAARHA